MQGLCGPVQMTAGSGDGADLGEQPAQAVAGHAKLPRRRKKETSGHRRGRRLRADARVFQRLVTVSRSVVVHHNSASSLALFLRASLLEQQGRKAPPVLLQQVALSAEEEPGPEEDRVGPLFAEVKNSALVLLQHKWRSLRRRDLVRRRTGLGRSPLRLRTPHKWQQQVAVQLMMHQLARLVLALCCCHIAQLLTLQRSMLRLHCPL